MVLAVRKHLEMAIIIILNNLEQLILMQFFPKNHSGKVLALALHLGVFGAGLHSDGSGCPQKHLEMHSG